MLGKSPIGHDSSSNHKENVTCDSLRCNVEAQPLIDLSCIICTCNDIEEKALRDLVSTFAIRSAKILQNNMAIEVGNLAEYPKPKPNLHLKVAYRGV